MSEVAHKTRRLAAILAADVVGYSRLMAEDEAATLDALKHHRKAVFNPLVERHGGRIVKLIGDGTLVEFASVVDALRCALAIQMQIASDTQTFPVITLRIGINLGDVIIEGDDIYGDGVNVAARLEPLADPGGICIARIVSESVGNRVDAPFVDAGEVQVKNIDRPIGIWKWRPDGKTPDPKAAEPAAKPDQDDRQISIAVLPFNNMSGDPEQEYFSDGISEDIITDLSKIAGLTVIARNSSFVYKGKSTDIRTVGRELGVTSVLEGSIRKAGNRVRITAQLIDARDGAHIWAERYDRDLTDIFEVQDEVTLRIVEALKVNLTAAESEQLIDQATHVPEAHDLVLKGRELIFGPQKNAEVFNRMLAIFSKAIELDPGYADAYGGLAGAYQFDFDNGWSGDAAKSNRLALEYSNKALSVDPKNGLGLFVHALATGSTGDLATAMAELEKLIELSPSFAVAHATRGLYNIFLGKPAEAIPHIERAIRLDPVFNQQYLQFLGVAHLLLGHYETAIVLFRQRILMVPDSDRAHSMLASALGHAGDVEGARHVWQDLMKIKPDYTFKQHMSVLPFKDPAYYAPLAEGLRKAGLPD